MIADVPAWGLLRWSRSGDHPNWKRLVNRRRRNHRVDNDNHGWRLENFDSWSVVRYRGFLAIDRELRVAAA